MFELIAHGTTTEFEQNAYTWINVKIYLLKNQDTRKLTTEKNIQLKYFDTFNSLLAHIKIIEIL